MTLQVAEYCQTQQICDYWQNVGMEPAWARALKEAKASITQINASRASHR